MAFLSRIETPAAAIASRLRWLPPTLARLTLGWVFLLSGWGKLHHLDDVIEFFGSLGIPAPQLQAPFAAGVEFVCGGLLLLGLFSRLAAAPLVVVMIVAIATARREELTSLGVLFGFIEYLYIVLLGYVAIEGPGPLSLDALLRRRR
jgi:putative oxidoreductase